MTFPETATTSQLAIPARVMGPDFLRALSFAARKHRDQRRKDSGQTPYINHPIAVADILLNEAGVIDEVVLMAALLHDTVEDTDTTFDELARHFGEVVRDVVAEVTDDKSLPKAERKRLQIEHAAGLSDPPSEGLRHRAKLVKLADKISNVRDTVVSPPEGWPMTRIDEYLDWGKAVISPIRGTHPQLEALFDHAYEQGKTTITIGD